MCMFLLEAMASGFQLAKPVIFIVMMYTLHTFFRHIDHALNPTITERSQTLHSSRASHKQTPEFLGKNKAARNRVKLAQASLGAYSGTQTNLPQDSPLQ